MELIRIGKTTRGAGRAAAIQHDSGQTMENENPSKPPPPQSLRKIVHDLNGEIFLIRGYVELTLQMTEPGSLVHTQMTKALERIDEFENIIRRLRIKQEELEPEG